MPRGADIERVTRDGGRRADALAKRWIAGDDLRRSAAGLDDGDGAVGE